MTTQTEFLARVAQFEQTRAYYVMCRGQGGDSSCS